MDNEQITQLKNLSIMFNPGRVMTPDHVKQILVGLLTILSNYKKDTNSLNSSTQLLVQNILEDVENKHTEMMQKSTDTITKVQKLQNDNFKSLIREVENKLSEVEKTKPKDGISPKIEDIIPAIMEQIKMPEQKEQMTDSPEETRDKLEELVGDERLDISAIKGIKEFFNSLFKQNNGGNDTIRQINTNGGGVQSITSKDGSVTISASGAKGKGVVDLKVANSGGSGLTKETPLGTVDNSNTSFTVVHVPFFINVNGAIYNVGDGQYTSLTTGSPNTITLSSPVGTGGFIKSYF